MALVLPTRTDGTEHYSFSTRLDGETFGFRFMWNAYGRFWMMHLTDASGAPLLSKTIRVGVPLLWRYKKLNLPTGEIVALDTEGNDEDPGLTDLGGRVQLIYLSAKDLAP